MSSLGLQATDANAARIQIANAALAKIGSRDLSDWTEDTERARAVVTGYDTVLQAVFGHPHRWRFATKTYKLNRLAETPENGWQYAYERPGDAMGEAVRVLRNPRDPAHPLREFASEAGVIYCNVADVWAAYIVNVAPHLWPGSFRNLVVTALAAELAVPEAQDTKLLESFTVMAWGTPQELHMGGLARVAINADISGAPVMSTPVDPDPLTSARFTW
jgi:hypothetical protein